MQFSHFFHSQQFNSSWIHVIMERLWIVLNRTRLIFETVTGKSTMNEELKLVKHFASL